MEEKRPKLTVDEIKANLRVICICKGIKQARICEAILQKKCESVDDVNRATGSGSGGCNGTRCKPVIEAILANNGRPLVGTLPRPDDSEDQVYPQADGSYR